MACLPAIIPPLLLLTLVVSAMGDCSCSYQGSKLPADLFTNYPTADPGKYKDMAAVASYGTMCAAWDSVPGTPFFSSCPASADRSLPENNWCNIPWCYVDASCSSAVSSSVFKGSTTAHYSYAACGKAPDCYSDGPSGKYGAGTAGCPYNPHSDGSFATYKKGDCECKYHNTVLPSNAIAGSSYASLPSINIYGTSCAAWDQHPDTPFFTQCPQGADWCHPLFNFCQAPWCYVDSACATKVSTSIWSTSMYYSYDTCLNTPNCYGSNTSALPSACPFDSNDNNWYTAKDCPNGWAPGAACECKHQGGVLPASTYENFPSSDAGKYKDYAAIALYGTMCAAWDNVPGTPYFSSCDSKDYSQKENNWCNIPWCYVDAACTSRVATSVFSGSTVDFYSYEACGSAPNCYSDGPSGTYGQGTTGCPYNPHGGTSYATYKDDCACTYQGQTFPSSIYSSSSDYGSRPNINIYGTTCAAWNQAPGMPYIESCPTGAEWCYQSYNWCQEPWCWVNSKCPTGISSTAFTGAAFYSYDTCLSAPDCYTNSTSQSDWPSLPSSCPYDVTDANWSTAKACPSGYVGTTTTTTPMPSMDDCECLYQGSSLPSDFIAAYPVTDPGKYKSLSSISAYGTSCAAWDSVPGTPWISYCPSNADFSTKDYNWCRIPWCYVKQSCATSVKSSVWKGSTITYYSYNTCGHAPDCYSAGPNGPNGQGTPGCPYDPHKGTFAAHKGNNCQCKYQGTALPSSTYSGGQYAAMKNVHIYGTTCAAWDQIPDTPFKSSCPTGAEWCSPSKNWCQEPWCYVSDTCATKVASSVFPGEGFYSYDTCMSAPDCYTNSAEAKWSSLPYNCPYDSRTSGWNTAKICPDGWVGKATVPKSDCSCKYQGLTLPQAFLETYPTTKPGKYKDLAAISKYGTMCAAWDQVPGTPFVSSCGSGTDFSLKENSWCQIPWCYVDSSCRSRVGTSVFAGSSTSFYSYDACGGAPDCYSDGPFGPYGYGTPGCPYDPYNDQQYKVFKASCPCLFHGQVLASDILNTYPTSTPGKYKDMTAVNLYGTTCAAWDQSPDTPWYSSCPLGAAWCSREKNWCQEPWCYVASSCPTKLPSSVFSGSNAAFYSYDTCLSTPDCYTKSTKESDWQDLPKSCPFDSKDNMWSTKKDCPTGWVAPAPAPPTGDCSCKFQGSTLGAELFTNYPSDDPGKYTAFAAIASYGTMCAAWDSVPGTPYFSSCPPSADKSDPKYNWCQIPWCYVDKSCSSKIATSVFKGSNVAYYSYQTCGNAPNCYSDGPSGAYGSGTTGCPYNPHGDGGYATFEKGDCACKYSGVELPSSLRTGSPYANLRAATIYGTTCAAWDQHPDTPNFNMCPKGADWCHLKFNWCQEPWCYVDSTCATATKTDVWSSSLYFSYSTCLKTPTCYASTKSAAAKACPFDSTDNKWYTAKECPYGWGEDKKCECKYHGDRLPESIYNNFPLSEPGKYKNEAAIAMYGSTCAAWDNVPGTPWFSSCDGKDKSKSENNWCNIPWCYVDPTCTNSESSSVFTGSDTAVYSYSVCGDAPNCYKAGPDGPNGQGTPGCPYDPNGGKSYATYKSTCPCKYAGQALPTSIYTSSSYSSLPNINLYGTTCAAWDQMPGTPWIDSCPKNAEWCYQTYNWCQEPWCYVADTCSTKKSSSVFPGSAASYYSYDTCLGTPDCYTGSAKQADWSSIQASCPFDSTDNGWDTAKDCPSGWVGTTTTTTPAPSMDDCECVFQGSTLPSDMIAAYPVTEPGKYKSLSSVSVYGTTCAAWDSVPGTPFQSSCPDTADFSTKEKNWCRVPWCYVKPTCAGAVKSEVFKGSSVAYFSYGACAHAPDCYSDGPNGKYGQGTPGCPYDPNKGTFAPYKGNNCECKYQGKELPTSVYTGGKYASMANVHIYGTTCVAWDQVPDTPFFSSCPKSADWCSPSYNWCQAPWCYVADTCGTKVASSVFPGEASYSYDTCMDTPDCYSNSAEAKWKDLPYNCPFDSKTTGWYTAKDCHDGWVGKATVPKSDCSCKFQGLTLPQELLTQHPSDQVGKYKDLAAISKYGTMCAAWDQVPGTPFASSCGSGKDFSLKENSWCQIPWCYVDSSCRSRISTSVWKGSTTSFYSYDSCGGAPDCYGDGPYGPYGYGTPGCPYDPYNDKAYKVFKASCPCIFHGQVLPSDLLNNYPTTDKGKYKDLTAVNVYGTTCAAWDQSPDTPWHGSCPLGAEWCSRAKNWCQEPWCYVSDSCSTALASSVFAGSTTAFYSYDTCLSAPDCYTKSSKQSDWPDLPGSCPFDRKDTMWSTAKDCPGGWAPNPTPAPTPSPSGSTSGGSTTTVTGDCSCKYQGAKLPDAMIQDYPSNNKGQYKTLPNIALYGTTCAAWDAVPGTPFSGYCPPTADFSKRENNWCSIPWCYVDKSCSTGVKTSVWNGHETAYYSYYSCGRAPDCYSDGPSGTYGQGTTGCPYDATGTGTYKPFKLDCPCSFHGSSLPDVLVRNYPSSDQGKYKNLPNIRAYGTTCAAWDQVPDTPYKSSCPSDADWCTPSMNWCQAPWCYVASSCSSAVSTSVFQGSTTAQYSYDTCDSTPDCYTNSAADKQAKLPASCPFTQSDMGWYTAKECPNGWVGLASTPAPSPVPTPPAAPGKVKVSFKVKNLRYETLMAYTDVRDQFIAKMKTLIAAKAGVSESEVAIFLTPGSVNVEAQVAKETAIVDTTNLAADVATEVASVPGISNIKENPSQGFQVEGVTYTPVQEVSKGSLLASISVFTSFLVVLAL